MRLQEFTKLPKVIKLGSSPAETQSQNFFFQTLGLPGTKTPGAADFYSFAHGLCEG